MRGYNAKSGILDRCSSCLGFTVAAQSWDQCGGHVTWIITSTTGMDPMPERGAVDTRCKHLVWNRTFENDLKEMSGGVLFFFCKKWNDSTNDSLDGAVGECAYFCLRMHSLKPSHYIFMHLCVCVCERIACVFLSDAPPPLHPTTQILPPNPPPMQIRTSHTSRQAAGCSVISHDQLRPSWQLCEQFH